MQGVFHDHEGSELRYQYNGTEYLSHAGLDVSLATWSTHDPAIGRWWQIDPRGEAMYSYSLYNAMGCNPVSLSDPDGDLPFLVMLGIGAATGIFSNGLSNLSNGKSFFDGAIKAGFWGAVSSAVSFGVGSIFGETGTLLNELGRAGAHAATGGALSAAQGGNFWHGFASGGISSVVGSGIGRINDDAGLQIIGGGVSGGIGAMIAGGDFFQGFGQGIAVGAFNHALHGLLEGGPGDPVERMIAEKNAKALGLTLDEYNLLVDPTSSVTWLDLAEAAFWAFDILNGGPSGEALGLSMLLRGGKATITGFTKHGTNQAITRGFKTNDIKTIVSQGKSTFGVGRYGPQTRHTLGGNTVVLNSTGRVVTVYSTAKNGIFIPF